MTSEDLRASRAWPGSLRYLSWLVDAAAAVTVIGVFWLPRLNVAPSDWHVGIGLLLAGVVGLSMVTRWRRPGAATAVAAIATLAGGLIGVSEDPMLATAWCLYPLAVTRASRTRVFVLVAVCLITVFAAVAAVPEPHGFGQRLVIAVAALGVSWLVGVTEGRRIQSAREIEQARAAEEAARVQLDVARDVHDVVGHALGVISAEAGVTRSLGDASEQELRDSLADVEQHARSALEDVQALVRLLRATSSDGGGQTDAAGLVPGFSRLPELISATQAAGVQVDARVDVSETIDEVVGAVAFRIVQEALSNVVRHASGASSEVEVRADGDALLVRVRDDGPGFEEGFVPGFGLQGVGERARAVGGTATWRNTPDGGVEVEARLPLGAAR